MTTQSTQPNTPKKPRREPKPLNGVDTPALFATINAVRERPELAKFCFRAENRWISGNHSRTTFGEFHGAGGEHGHVREFSFEADHHPILCGSGHAPTPVEFLLHALAGCIVAGIGNIAAARGVEIESVTAKVEGDIDLLGLLGLSESVRNGYQSIRIEFDLHGNAPAEKLREIVEQARARSAVFDVLTKGIPVNLSVRRSIPHEQEQ